MLDVFAIRTNGQTRVYRDALGLDLFARFEPGKGPNRRSKRIALNCYSWRVVWVANNRKR